MIITGIFVSYKERDNSPCELTTEHAESSLSNPVLMIKGMSYGSEDIDGAIIINPVEVPG